VLLQTGRVLLVAGSGNDPTQFAAGTFRSTIWDPSQDTFQDLSTPTDLFCSGHALLPDGRILVMGGNKSYPTTSHGYEGLPDSYVFDPGSGQYTRVNDLGTGHWYPSATELSNGDVLSLGGLDENGNGTVRTERFSYATNRWNDPPPPQSYYFWGLYPSMIVLADGRLFYSGSHVFGNGTPGTGASIYDPANNTVTDVPGLRHKDERDQSSAVLLPPAQDQRVAIFGGGNIVTNVDANRTTDIIDLKQPTPTYVPGPDIPQGTVGNVPETGDQGKMYVSTVILPTGMVLEAGGGLHNRADPVKEASLFDPKQNVFTPVAPDPVPRTYHSESFLLPDGRVASLGGNPADGSFEMRISVYSPWYMFSLRRPEITRLSSTEWGYGRMQRINATRPIDSAVLIKPSAVTHSSDPNQRLVDLRITAGVRTPRIRITMANNSNVAPPGWYMLFVNSRFGPSEARWVHVS
jgi:hypothetical protein